MLTKEGVLDDSNCRLSFSCITCHDTLARGNTDNEGMHVTNSSHLIGQTRISGVSAFSLPS